MRHIELQGNEKIVLLEYHRIGDALMALPILTAIKKKFPSTYTVAVLDKVATGITDNNPFIDKTIFIDRKAPVIKNLIILKNLYKEKFDIAIDSLGMPKTAIAGVLLGAKVRLGMQPKRKYLYTHLYRKENASCYSSQDRLEILKLTNTHPDSRIYPQIWIDESEKMRLIGSHPTFPLDQPFISSAPGSKIPGIKYSASDWAHLYNHVLEHYDYPIVLFGSPEEHSFINEIYGNIDDKNRCRIISLNNAREVAILISLASFHICRDNGSKHMANALGIDTFTVWDGRASSRNWISDNPAIYDFNYESLYEADESVRQKKLIDAAESFFKQTATISPR